MKIYFSATITNNEKLRENYLKIIDIIRKEGHFVVENGSISLDSFLKSQSTENDTQSVYKRFDKFLRNAEVFITDISEPSVNSGYEISEALTQRKPVLVLRNQKSDLQILPLILGNKSPYLKYKTYEERNLQTILKKFLDSAEDKIDTKFILIIPPPIDRYLEWNARERSVPKAEVTREAIDRAMNNDKTYQTFIKKNEITEE
jgi:hypothetical protein